MKIYKEDINYLKLQIEEIHPNPYLYYKKEFFYKDLDELEKKSITLEEFKYEIRKIVAKLNDSHLTALYKRSLFWEVKLINNKVYIIHDYRNQNSKYLYKEIKNINGVNIQNIIPLIIDIVPSKNQSWQKAMVQYNLLSKEFLKSVNIIKDDKYIIELDDGTVVDGNKEMEKEAKCLIKYFDQKQILDDTYYIKYSKCYSPKPNVIEEFLEEVINNIKKIKPQNIIVDLRDNTGGKSSYFSKVYKFFKEEFNDVNYYTLIDEYVFSSGRWALQEMLDINSIVIGTPPGASRDVFGEAKKIILPNSKIEFICSSKYFKYEGNEFKEYIKDNINMVNEYIEDCYEPHFIIEQSIEDYKNGDDVAFFKTQELINSNRKGNKKC